MDMPSDLTRELLKMRRNPAIFTVGAAKKCKFCGSDKLAYNVLNAESVIGLWCKVHGWLFFDSVKFPPTERLTATEIEDYKQEQRRKAEFSRRSHQRSERL